MLATGTQEKRKDQTTSEDLQRIADKIIAQNNPEKEQSTVQETPRHTTAAEAQQDSSVIAQVMNSTLPSEDNSNLRKKYERLILAENEYEQNWRCDICGEAEDDEEDLVICNFCLVVVHPSCHRRDLYQSDPAEEGVWHCERCRFLLERETTGKDFELPKCFLCPDQKGAMIKLASGDWVHHTCVNWHNEIWFEDDDIEIANYGGTVNFKLFQTTCDLCGLRAHGSCIPCDAKYCRVHFHVRCAIFAGLLDGGDTKNPGGKVFCHKHQPENIPGHEIECKRFPQQALQEDKPVKQIVKTKNEKPEYDKRFRVKKRSSIVRTDDDEDEDYVHKPKLGPDSNFIRNAFKQGNATDAVAHFLQWHKTQDSYPKMTADERQYAQTRLARAKLQQVRKEEADALNGLQSQASTGRRNAELPLKRGLEWSKEQMFEDSINKRQRQIFELRQISQSVHSSEQNGTASFGNPNQTGSVAFTIGQIENNVSLLDSIKTDKQPSDDQFGYIPPIQQNAFAADIERIKQESDNVPFINNRPVQGFSKQDLVGGLAKTATGFSMLVDNRRAQVSNLQATSPAAKKMVKIDDINKQNKMRFKIDRDLAKMLEIFQWVNFEELVTGFLKFDKRIGCDFYDKNAKIFRADRYPYFLQFFPDVSKFNEPEDQVISHRTIQEYCLRKHLEQSSTNE